MEKEIKKAVGLSSDYLFHPGETLKEVLEGRNMSQNELAIRTGVTSKHVSSLISGKTDISSSYARKLEYALGIQAQFWINLQSNYDRELFEYQESNQISDEEKAIIKELKPAIDDYHNRGWIDANESSTFQVIKMREILGISNLCNITRLPEAAAYRMQSKIVVNPYVLFAWQRMCELLTENIKVENELNIELLKSKVDQIKSLMFKKPNEMWHELKQIFSECGIAFDIVHNYPGAPVQGFIKNANGKMTMCVTLRRKDAGTFWFTLFHEIGHIVNGDEKNKFIDFDSNAVIKSEAFADSFANNALLNQTEYDSFILKNNINRRSVIELARKCNVKPFVVVGRLANDKIIEWNEFNDLKVKYEWK